METKKIKMIFLVLLLLVAGDFACADDRDNNCIIFWDYNPKLSIAYLDNASVAECSRRYKNHIKINFSEFSHFSSDSKTFVFVHEMDADLLRKFENQFDRAKDGKLFFSVVIDNSIILNGLNRVSPQFLLPSSCFVIDESDCPIIYSIKKKCLRISNVFNLDEDYDNDCMDSMTAKMIQNILD